MREERELAECKVCEKQTIAARDKEWATKAFSLLDELAPTLYSAEDAFTIRKFIEQLKREVGQ